MNAPPPYSAVERMLHAIAFAGSTVQLAAADVERALHGRTFTSVQVERPVFITSLPRAGTTLVLERLAQCPDAASQCYRDMPFVLAPILWAQLSAPFRVAGAKSERAHGDGMQVDVDSPEAFEEVLWHAYWPKKFGKTRIDLWTASDAADEFPDAFRSLMQRVIVVRSTPEHPRRRYVAKNNANVARLTLLTRLFPDAKIVVPFREPLAQAVSLLSQHQRFLGMHAEHPFTRRYMRDIGHFEFGALHRPLNFPGVDGLVQNGDPTTLDYWLGYWVHGFRHVLDNAAHVHLVSYERLCGGGDAALTRLTSTLGLEAQATDDGTAFWEPRSYRDRATSLRDPDLLTAADALHASLLEHALI